MGRQTININQKELWEKLAKTDANYYIFSDNRGISENEYRKSGEEAFEKHILQDELLMSKAGGSILDLGCGNGRITEFMPKVFGSVYGIDISAEMIKQANKRVGYHKNITFIENDGLKIPLPEEMFDVVFSFLVFQHFKTKEMVEKNFAEVWRVLKKGGIFKVLIGVKKHKSLKAWWSGVHYEKSEINQLCKDFKIIKTESVGDYSLWLWLTK
jgi:ubiquinone/menaquinone biosynthesis C-methylase UbiE